MNTIIDLMRNLQKIVDEHGDMPIIGVVGSSGTPYEVGSASFRTINTQSDIEIMDYLDLDEHDNYCRLYLGN